MTEKLAIPKGMKPTYEAVVALTREVCKKHLNEEWTLLSYRLAAALARKRPSPLIRGEPQIWAAGILHSLGMVNFLSAQSQSRSQCESYMETPVFWWFPKSLQRSDLFLPGRGLEPPCPCEH